MQHSRINRFLSPALAFAGILLLASAAEAAVLIVDGDDPACNDVVGTPYCTISAAIVDAQSGDSVQISEGTYYERGLIIDDDIALIGAGARLTLIDGQNTAPRILTIASGAEVSLMDLSLRNGKDESSGSVVIYDGQELISADLEGGGAIHNLGDLTLSSVAVDSNVTVGYGGGIFNEGRLTLDRTTVSRNTALHGGGVKHNGELLTVINSTFSGNSTTESGAALSLDGNAVFTNATVHDNTADSDGNNSGHAGGVAVGDFTWGLHTGDFPTNVVLVSLRNTLIAGNRDNSPSQNSPPHDCRGPVISLGHNLMQVTAGCKITVNGVVRDPYTTDASDELSDLFGTYPSYSLDARLGALADNGGPTDTHALLANSPAIDAGTANGCPSDDQRDLLRPADGNSDGIAVCDIGAVETGCGNGVVQANLGELCDDGNRSNADACTNSCVPAACGDGFVQAGQEACDDGALNSDTAPDACREDCTEPACGDGIVDSDEECDDGNDSNADGCHTDCRLPACGDGILDSGEKCDDGNVDNADACLNTCAAAECGDGFLRIGVEFCDDGALNSDTTPDACREDCTEPACGDGIVDSDEECDDGALNSDTAPDACREDCTEPACGDGIVDSDEECDHGKANGAQGTCSAECLEAVQEPTDTTLIDTSEATVPSCSLRPNP